jgi:hypothetical protein
VAQNDPFQQIVDALDLDSAVRRGSERNDLLPPRMEDGVLGEVGKRFSESLRTKLERGRYDPTPAEWVFVPKPGTTTRPAALLTLADRVVYDAVVELLRPRIDTALLGKDIVFWPRGIDVPKRWLDFERAALAEDTKYVAISDITGFYEMIEHERLRDILVSITGRREAVNALIEFLRRVMRNAKGIPQGLAASDPIATAYLSPVDSAMARECLNYSRHGDDIRIAAKSVSEARRALYCLELELRRVGLLANSSKSIIMRRDTYESTMASTARVNQETRETLLRARKAEIEEDPEKLEKILEETEQEQLGWELFYHGRMSLAEVIAELEPHLQPTDMDVAIEVLRDALAKLPHTPGGLSREEFHIRVSSSLVQLAAGKSALAIEHVANLLAGFPEKTEVVANYLISQSQQVGSAVVAEVIRILDDDRFKTDWEVVWLLTVLRQFVAALDANQILSVKRLAYDEDQSVFCRVEAIKLLGMLGELEHSVVRRLWNTAAPCFHPDLVAAAHYARSKASWCDAFLAGVVEDPVNKVVIRHLEANG